MQVQVLGFDMYHNVNEQILSTNDLNSNILHVTKLSSSDVIFYTPSLAEQNFSISRAVGMITFKLINGKTPNLHAVRTSPDNIVFGAHIFRLHKATYRRCEQQSP
jgi:hypothetical protein